VIQTLESSDGSDLAYHPCTFAQRAGQEAGAYQDNNNRFIYL
jgi:hypothetical protein